MAESPPEWAIQCAEQVLDLTITLHDLEGRLRGRVAAQRLSHRHPRCSAARAKQPQTCVQFDVDQTRRALDRHPQGFIQRCPFGVREAVVPCFRDGQLSWILFAGPLADRGETDDLCLEILRQLAARLRLWEDAHPSWPSAHRVERGGAGQPDHRQRAIQRWITVHHTEVVNLDDLAAALGLSRFQASRTVSKTCGRSFQQLLLAARLATAQDLLRETDLPMVEVALRSGFGDRAHFHRCFRNAFAISPQAWRRSAPQSSALAVVP